LSALAHPVFCTLQVELEVFPFLQGLIRAEFLNALSIARTPPIRDDNAKHRLILCADALHPNFDCHKSVFPTSTRLVHCRCRPSFCGAAFQKEGGA
jgi:hypothetical protein